MANDSADLSIDASASCAMCMSAPPEVQVNEHSARMVPLLCAGPGRGKWICRCCATRLNIFGDAFTSRASRLLDVPTRQFQQARDVEAATTHALDAVVGLASLASSSLAATRRLEADMKIMTVAINRLQQDLMDKNLEIEEAKTFLATVGGQHVQVRAREVARVMLTKRMMEKGVFPDGAATRVESYDDAHRIVIDTPPTAQRIAWLDIPILKVSMSTQEVLALQMCDEGCRRMRVDKADVAVVAIEVEKSFAAAATQAAPPRPAGGREIFGPGTGITKTDIYTLYLPIGTESGVVMSTLKDVVNALVIVPSEASVEADQEMLTLTVRPRSLEKLKIVSVTLRSLETRPIPTKLACRIETAWDGCSFLDINEDKMAAIAREVMTRIRTVVPTSPSITSDRSRSRSPLR